MRLLSITGLTTMGPLVVVLMFLCHPASLWNSVHQHAQVQDELSPLARLFEEIDRYESQVGAQSIRSMLNAGVVERAIDVHASSYGKGTGGGASAERIDNAKVLLRLAFQRTLMGAGGLETPRQTVLCRVLRNRGIIHDLFASGSVEEMRRKIAQAESAHSDHGVEYPACVDTQFFLGRPGGDLAIDGAQVRLEEDYGYSGNHNGAIDAGETVKLRLPIQNNGERYFRSLSGFLETEDPYVEIDRSEVVYNEVPAGSTNPGSGAYILSISPQCPDGYKVSLRILAWDSDHGKQYLPIEVEVFNVGPLVVGEERVDDDIPGLSNGNDDGQVNPGEVIELVLGIRNRGQVSIEAVQATLSCQQGFVAFVKSALFYHHIDPTSTESHRADYEFEVSESDFFSQELWIVLEAKGQSRGFSYTWHHPFTVPYQCGEAGDHAREAQTERLARRVSLESPVDTGGPVRGRLRLKDGWLVDEIRWSSGPFRPVLIKVGAFTLPPATQGGADVKRVQLTARGVDGQEVSFATGGGDFDRARTGLGSAIRGRVFYPDGTPVHNARVLAILVQGHDAWLTHAPFRYSARSNAKGRFELRGLRRGLYRVEAWVAEGGSDAHLRASDAFRDRTPWLRATHDRVGTGVDDLEIRIEAGTFIRGVLFDVAGKPLSGHVICATGDVRTGGSVTTDAEGHFAIAVAHNAICDLEIHGPSEFVRGLAVLLTKSGIAAGTTNLELVISNHLGRIGRVDEEITELEARAEEAPDDPERLFALGVAYLVKIQEANHGLLTADLLIATDRSLDHVLEIDPTHWDARFTKAMALSYWPQFLGRTRDAIHQFETLVAQQTGLPPSPEHAEVHLMLGNLHLQVGDPQAALAAWKQGLRLFPDHAGLQEQEAIEETRMSVTTRSAHLRELLPGVAEKLGLSAHQKDALEAALVGLYERQAEYTVFYAEHGPRKEIGEKAASDLGAFLAEISTILSPAQYELYRSLKGGDLFPGSGGSR